MWCCTNGRKQLHVSTFRLKLSFLVMHRCKILLPITCIKWYCPSQSKLSKIYFEEKKYFSCSKCVVKILKDIFLRRCSESLLLKYDNPLKSGAISHKTSTRPEHKRKRKHCKTETKKNISSWLAGSAPEHTSGRFYNWFWMGARAIIYAKSEVEKTLENLQKRVSRKRFQPPFLGSRRWTRVRKPIQDFTYFWMKGSFFL